MSLLGKVLMRVGRIPRGRAKAPSLAEPVADVSSKELSTRLRKQKGYLDRIASQREEVVNLRQRFRHPLLGEFSARDGVRFVRVHTDHHLRIVREIMHAVKST